MNERIKKLRKSLGLTQQEFGDRIGIKRAAISLIESGANNPSDQTVLAICREFHIRDFWLRTGEGDMLEPEPVDEVDRIAEVYHVSDYGKALIRAVLQMDEKTQQMVVEAFQSSLRPSEPPQSAPTGDGDSLPPETAASGLTASQEAELAEIARQMRLETEAAAKSSLSSAG